MTRLLFLAALLPAAGCDNTSTTDTEFARAGGAAGRDAVAVGDNINPESCSALLGDLPTGDAAPVPDAEQAMLRNEFRLTEDEMDEVTRPAFTNLDAEYLSECLFFQQVARGLAAEPDKLDPREAVRRAFGWAQRAAVPRSQVQAVRGRQVRLSASPPAYAARRGTAFGYEKVQLFLALAQQMGLDGCVVLKPSEKGAELIGVGARAGQDVAYVARETFFAVGPAEGDGDATRLLSGAEKKGELIAGLAVPLSALAPRMKRAEDSLARSVRVRLRVDPVALKARFAGAAGKVEVVNADPRQRDSRLRSLAYFLPVNRGGLFEPDEQNTPFGVFKELLVPLAKFPPEMLPAGPGGPPERVTARAYGMFVEPFEELYLPIDAPRMLAWRGQYRRAERALTEQLTAQERRLSRAESEGSASRASAASREWVRRAGQVYAGSPDRVTLARLWTGFAIPEVMAKREELMRMQDEARGRGDDREQVELPELNPAGADAELVQLGRLARARVDRPIGREMTLRLTFQLAQLRHEFAERTRLQSGGGGSEALWAEAVDAWDQYMKLAESRAATAAKGRDGEPRPVQPSRRAHAKAWRAHAAAELVKLKKPE